jgi:gas vesicle protein
MDDIKITNPELPEDEHYEAKRPRKITRVLGRPVGTNKKHMSNRKVLQLLSVKERLRILAEIAQLPDTHPRDKIAAIKIITDILQDRVPVQVDNDQDKRLIIQFAEHLNNRDNKIFKNNKDELKDTTKEVKDSTETPKDVLDEHKYRFDNAEDLNKITEEQKDKNKEYIKAAKEVSDTLTLSLFKNKNTDKDFFDDEDVYYKDEDL